MPIRPLCSKFQSSPIRLPLPMFVAAGRSSVISTSSVIERCAQGLASPPPLPSNKQLSNHGANLPNRQAPARNTPDLPQVFYVAMMGSLKAMEFAPSFPANESDELLNQSQLTGSVARRRTAPWQPPV
jgi:hypothetical protein